MTDYSVRSSADDFSICHLGSVICHSAERQAYQLLTSSPLRSASSRVRLSPCGRWMLTRTPLPSLLSISISPPCSRTIRLTISNPRPEPADLVVKYGRKTLLISWEEIPPPVSLKETETLVSSCQDLM